MAYVLCFIACWNEGESWETVVRRDILQLDGDVGRVRFRKMNYDVNCTRGFSGNVWMSQ